MKQRRGIALLITLASIALLSGLVLLFLKKNHQTKHHYMQLHTLIQSNLLIHDFSQLLAQYPLSQEEIFYGSNLPITLDLHPARVTLRLSSAHHHLDINTIVRQISKNQKLLNTFLAWLKREHVSNPTLLLALLLDTIDTDRFERSYKSEIIRTMPQFQNGQIPNRQAMQTILDTYHHLANDHLPTLQRWEEVFGYTKEAFDLNYANRAQLSFLFPSFPQEALDTIAQHAQWWRQPNDIPIDPSLRQQLRHSDTGIPLLFSSHKIALVLKYQTDQCQITTQWIFNLRQKKIEAIDLSPVECKPLHSHPKKLTE